MKWVAPHLLVGEGDVGEYVLLPGDPGRARRIASFLDDSVLKAENREYVVYTGFYRGIKVSVVSTGIGGPSAAIALEELARCGSRFFVRVGTCGALRKGVRVGSIIVPYAAVRLDGVTKRYAPPEYPAVAHPLVFNALVDAARSMGVKPVTGIIVSDDKFYISKNEIEEMTRLNTVAVEMEASTIMLLSSLKNLYGGAILVVDGNLVEGTGKAEKGAQEGSEVPRIVREAVDLEIRIALEAIRRISEKKEEL